MSKLFILLSTFAFFCCAKTDFCQPNYVLGDFPEDIMKDMYVGATTGDVPDFQGCPPDVKIDSDKVVLWYNSASNPDEPIRLDHNDPKEIDPSQRLVILIHGWLCNVTSDLMPELKDAYLQRYKNISVIRVEWNTYATDRYVNSYCYLPKVAKVLGTFLCNLNSTKGLQMHDVHFVGHSMGAQASGLSGKEVQKQCQQTVGRITGLDPAGPLFKKAKSSERLHKTDATIVDVIHTNQNQLGYHGSCGTVDFYPNCGFFQPNSIQLTDAAKLEEMKPLPLNDLLRNHLLAAEYMVESILHGSFRATSCKNCGTPRCEEDPTVSDETVMGEHYITNGHVKDKFFVNTNGNKPYNRGTNQRRM